jgi:hypothetical protein
MTPCSKTNPPPTPNFLSNTHKKPHTNTKTKMKIIQYYEHGHKVHRFITECLDCASCSITVTIPVRTHIVTWLNSTLSIVDSNPRLQHKTLAEAQNKGGLNGFIMLSPLLQLLTTTGKYCEIRCFSTKLSGRGSCPLIRRSRGGRIPPLTTRDRMART